MNNYVICKLSPSYHIQYWNTNIGWTEIFDMAHTYDKNILDYPLPTGSGCVMEVTKTGYPINQFSIDK